MCDEMPKQEQDVPDYNGDGPEHLRVTSNEHLEALLLEGLQSPAHEMTDARWEELERRFRERYAKTHKK